MSRGTVVGKEAMIKRLMRQKKSSSSKNISQRDSTILNEFSKFLGNVHDEVFTREEAELKCSLLNMNGLCEYCEVNPAKTLTGGDHLFPLVKDKSPTDACNDAWNMVPSCGTCNSSKGGNTLEEWVKKTTKNNPFHKMDVKNRERIVSKILAYAKVADERRYRKTFDREALESIKTCIMDALKSAEESMAVIHKTTTYKKGK